MLTSSQLVSSHQTVWSLNWFYRQSFNQKLVDTCLEWKYKLIDSIIDERLYNLLWQYDNHDFSNPRDKNEQLNNRLSAIIGRIFVQSSFYYKYSLSAQNFNAIVSMKAIHYILFYLEYLDLEYSICTISHFSSLYYLHMITWNLQNCITMKVKLMMLISTEVQHLIWLIIKKN